LDLGLFFVLAIGNFLFSMLRIPTCSPPVLPPLLAKTAAVVGVLKNEDTPNFTPRQNEVTLTKEKGADDRMIPL
jgi:hypothetical protein